jgi:hypothetical protein
MNAQALPNTHRIVQLTNPSIINMMAVQAWFIGLRIARHNVCFRAVLVVFSHQPTGSEADCEEGCKKAGLCVGSAA